VKDLINLNSDEEDDGTNSLIDEIESLDNSDISESKKKINILDSLLSYHTPNVNEAQDEENPDEYDEEETNKVEENIIEKYTKEIEFLNTDLSESVNEIINNGKSLVSEKKKLKERKKTLKENFENYKLKKEELERNINNNEIENKKEMNEMLKNVIEDINNTSEDIENINKKITMNDEENKNMYTKLIDVYKGYLTSIDQFKTKSFENINSFIKNKEVLLSIEGDR
jgi:hypothetical protein